MWMQLVSLMALARQMSVGKWASAHWRWSIHENRPCYRAKHVLMPANKILFKYQKLESDCSVFLHLGTFLLFFLYSRKKFLSSCVSLSALLWEGTHSVRLSRRILDSSFRYFFESCSSPRSFYLRKTGHVNAASAAFHKGYWHMPLLIHTGNKRNLFTLSPTSWTFHGEVPTNALAFPLLLAL